MMQTLELTRMAQALSAQAGARMGVVAANVANADTPGYRARDLAPFAESYGRTAPLRATRAGHLTTAAQRTDLRATVAVTGDAPNGNSVSLEAEMIKAAQARQDQTMALSVYRTVSQMTRLALGRSV